METSVEHEPLSLSTPPLTSPAVQQWADCNKKEIHSLLNRSGDGTIRIKTTQSAAQKAKLPHQWLLVKNDGVYTSDGQRFLASLPPKEINQDANRVA